MFICSIFQFQYKYGGFVSPHTTFGYSAISVDPSKRYICSKFQFKYKCTGWFFYCPPYALKKLKYVKPRLGVSTLT